jgi:hypothetical protein
LNLVSGSPTIPSSSEELTVAAVGANLQFLSSTEYHLPSVNKIHSTGVQEQRERLLLLEIIEHDGVGHDLTEAGYHVELSDHFCHKRTSRQRGSRLKNAMHHKEAGEHAGNQERSVPSTGEDGALPPPARATITGLRRWKTAGLAELADEVHRPTWSSDQEQVKPGNGPWKRPNRANGSSLEGG